MSDMTRAEAIKTLKRIIEVANTSDCGIKEIDGIDEEALEIAINSLQIDEQYDLAMEQAETVSLKVYEQVMWERNIAIQQLKELGYGFGEKIETIDDKPVTGIRKYRKEARRWKRKYIRVNNQLSKCKKLLENDDIQSHTDEMWEKAKESEVNNGQETD